ncbi:hypothetical protein [Brasilonema sp. UFV-L1]|uniref:hypothetical protein n=2 Tax=Brasilonema sp. UFV-L1 TaxID=2234130 RepID=UPI002006E4E1|nr:hypothetical protein [Brasilonema sp. UFV-L1]
MGWEQDVSLPEAQSQMFTSNLDTSADLAIALLTHYSFDLGGYSASELVNLWQKQYPGNWLHLAVIEALYQGRYKAISVQQILTCWQRRGQAIFHFNMEFERLICSKFPQSLTALPTVSSSSVETTPDEGKHIWEEEDTPNSPHHSISLQPQHQPSHRNGSLHTPGNSPKFKAAEATAPKTPNNPQPPLRREPPEAKNFSMGTPSPQYPNQKDNDDFLTMATNNPPIEQFTPETSASSESFTSKLKAISNEKLYTSRKFLPGSPHSSVSEEIEMDNSY